MLSKFSSRKINTVCFPSFAVPRLHMNSYVCMCVCLYAYSTKVKVTLSRLTNVTNWKEEGQNIRWKGGVGRNVLKVHYICVVKE